MSTQINLSKRIAIKNECVTLTPNVNSINFEGTGINATTSGDDVTVTVPGSYGSTIFYLNESVPQAPYKEFSAVITTAVEQIVPFTVAGGVTTTIASYQTPSGVPGTTLIPGGFWQFYLHFNATTAGQNWIIRPYVYKRDLGGIETLILTSDPFIVTNMGTTTTQYTSDAVLSSTSLLVTDRLVVKIDMQNTTGVSQTANFRTEGSTHYSVVANTLNQNTAIPAPGIIVLGSGTCSTMRCGVSNTATNACSAALSGSTNASTAAGAVIAGGGNNTASGTLSFIGGGACNTASGQLSTVSGGYCNISSVAKANIVGGQKNSVSALYGFVGSGICNNATNATNGCLSLGAVVVGGVGNNTCGGTWDLATCQFTVAPTICNAGKESFVGGGFQNNATFCGATIGGGKFNTASNYWSTVSGGYKNLSSCFWTTIGGGASNTSSGNTSTIGGGTCGAATAAGATISGGATNIASGANSTIAGGRQNTASAAYAIVGSGRLNTASGNSSSILGGCLNSVSGFRATIVGGICNLNNSIDAFIGGGNCNNTCNATSGCLSYGAVVVGGVGNNTTGGTWSQALCCFSVAPTICNAGQFSFVGGGFQNTATGNFAVVTGGCQNNVDLGSIGSTISGGSFNRIGNTAFGFGYCSSCSFIGGGWLNTIYCGNYNTITGGYGNNIQGNQNFIGGGANHTANNSNSSVVGGINNQVTGYRTGVLGGQFNIVSGNTGSIVGGLCNTSSGTYASILGGTLNVASCSHSFIVGSNITTNRACTTFVNNLSIMNIPTSSAGLPAGSVWRSGTALQIV